MSIKLVPLAQRACSGLLCTNSTLHRVARILTLLLLQILYVTKSEQKYGAKL